MHEPYCDTATLLSNGKVLITRGYYYDAQADLEYFVRDAELYDPSTGTFAFLGNTITHHFGGTATPLLNGKVLIAGGGTDFPTVSAELYDQATGTFTMAGSLVIYREQDTATLLSDGTVLVAGGHRDPPNAEFYNPLPKHSIISATCSLAGNLPRNSAP
jgi:hypothetical protein